MRRYSGGLVTAKHWDEDDPIIADHFPGGPRIVPGAFLGEQAAQSALLLAMFEGMAHPREILLLTSLRCDFPSSALAPCVVVTDVSFRATLKSCFGFQARCTVDDKAVARVSGMAVRPPVGVT